mmetsp:Transcript_91694/g.182191  ORF Transcript_91694/g.182191 Transcript_91694/m.182191 type:complete len:150 (-) Transcript_91694:10-459(-)
MYQDSVLGSIEPSLSEVLGVKPVADFDNDDSLSSSGSSSSSCSSSGEEERAGSPRDAAASGSQWRRRASCEHILAAKAAPGEAWPCGGQDVSAHRFAMLVLLLHSLSRPECLIYHKKKTGREANRPSAVVRQGHYGTHVVAPKKKKTQK